MVRESPHSRRQNEVACRDAVVMPRNVGRGADDSTQPCALIFMEYEEMVRERPHFRRQNEVACPETAVKASLQSLQAIISEMTRRARHPRVRISEDVYNSAFTPLCKISHFLSHLLIPRKFTTPSSADRTMQLFNNELRGPALTLALVTLLSLADAQRQGPISYLSVTPNLTILYSWEPKCITNNNCLSSILAPGACCMSNFQSQSVLFSSD